MIKIIKTLLLIIIVMTTTPLFIKAENISIPANFQTLPKSEKISILKELIAHVTERIQKLIKEKQGNKDLEELKDKLKNMSEEEKFLLSKDYKTIKLGKDYSYEMIKYKKIKSGNGKKAFVNYSDVITISSKVYGKDLKKVTDSGERYDVIYNITEDTREMMVGLREGDIVRSIDLTKDGEIIGGYEMTVVKVVNADGKIVEFAERGVTAEDNDKYTEYWHYDEKGNRISKFLFIAKSNDGGGIVSGSNQIYTNENLIAVVFFDGEKEMVDIHYSKEKREDIDNIYLEKWEKIIEKLKKK